MIHKVTLRTIAPLKKANQFFCMPCRAKMGAFAGKAVTRRHLRLAAGLLRLLGQLSGTDTSG